VFLAGGLPSVLYDRTHPITQSIGYSLTGMSFALVVLRLVLADRSSRGLIDATLSTRAMRSIGRYSYAMYVVHFPLSKLWGERILHSLAGPEPYSPTIALTYALVLTAVAYCLGMASYYLIERPFLRQKDRFVISSRELRIRSHP
jgi:peptidoglycan/LPS O-acetylase OafA/YrhL